MSEDGPRPGGEPLRLAPVVEVEILRHGEAWTGSGVGDAMVELAAHAALAAAAPAGDTHYELTIVLTDDAEVRDLNRTWRNKDEPTNVLSFPAGEFPAGADGLSAAAINNGCVPLGDIVIAFETTAREAAEKNLPLTDHLSHLVVHGALHLLGFDHLNDADAEQMEDLERQALASLGVSDPYGGEDRPDFDGEAGLAEIAS